MKKILFLFILLLLKTSSVVAQSPILVLDADKGLSNTTWQDQSGNNNHITLSKPAPKNEDGVYFDGNNSAILSKTLPLSNFTIYMTVKFETLGGTLLGNGQPSEYGLHYPNNVVYSATDKPAADFGTTALTTNKLITLALTRDVNKNSGNVTLFVNGEQIGVFQGSHKNTFNLTNLCGEMGYLFKGWMKNVAVYNVVHDADFIKSNSTIVESKLPLIDKIPIESQYVELEKNASPQLQQELKALRLAGVQKKWTFQVAATSVANYKISDITGALRADANMLRLGSPRPPLASTTVGNAQSKTYDLRRLNLVTPIRFQKQCGSCWAFATVAAIESAHILRNKFNTQTLDLSEQQILDCSKAGSCSGGSANKVFDFLKSNFYSLFNESEFPYYAKDGACRLVRLGGLGVENWGWVGANPSAPTRQEIKQAIVEYAGVVSYVWVNSAFKLYGGAVLNDDTRDPKGNEGGHFVQIIGWNDDLDAWLIKNSWHTTWGDNGFGWIDYDVLEIGKDVIWAVANKATPPIDVPIDQPVDVIKIETAVKATILVNKNIIAQEIFNPQALSSDFFSFKLFEVVSKPSNGFPTCEFIAVGNVTAKYLGAVDTEDGRVYNYNITSPNMKLSNNKKYVLDVAPYSLKLTPKRGFQMSKPQKDCNGVIANGSVLKLGFSAVKIL